MTARGRAWRIVLLIVIVAAYLIAFRFSLRTYTLDHAYPAQRPVHVVLYFSTNEAANNVLYVFFAPCVEGLLLARQDAIFAYGDQYFWAAQEIERKASADQETSRSISGWYPARPIAAVIWLGAICGLLLWYPHHVMKSAKQPS
jgi:hypothetical protein